jgi:hypothetical protein
MQVDSAKKAKRGRPFGSNRKNKCNLVELAMFERLIFAMPVKNAAAGPKEYTSEAMKEWAKGMLDASPNKEETQKKRLQMAQEWHPSTAHYRRTRVPRTTGLGQCLVWRGVGFC